MGGNVQQGGSSAPALTREAYLGMCAEAQAKRTTLPVFVQSRRAGVTFCSRVLDVVEGRGSNACDFFQLETDLGVNWVPHHKVRACSGLDGRCACEAGARSGRACAAAHAAAAPLGNTGVAT